MKLQLQHRARDLALRFEFWDLLILVFLIAIVRQPFWSLENETAWFLTVPVAVVYWLGYLSTKDPTTKRFSVNFWLIVGVPLLLAYALRAPFPDTSFDVWGLRLFHSERALQGFLYRPEEFFPTAAPFNPTPDMITGLFRHALGYRLGTVVNLLALLWTASVINKLLSQFLTSDRLRAVATLLVLFTEHFLFEINNYMPDLLALPVLAEATRLTLENPTLTKRRVLHVVFLISLAVTLKLSNAAVAMPIVLIWIWRCMTKLKFKEFAITSILSLIVFIAPLLYFSIWVYRLTGSPIFPLYNGVFRSPLYPPLMGWDDRWGGYGVFEILLWPILIFFHPERTAEIVAYSGRLSIGFVVAIICLCTAKLRSTIRQIAFILVLGTLLWSVTMGYIRYGLLLELLSGVLLVVVAVSLLVETKIRSWQAVAGILIAVLLVAQSAMAGRFLLRQEWSMRPTAIDDFGAYRREWTHVWRDRSLHVLLGPKESQLIDNVDVWVVSGTKTPGLMILLNDRPPFVGVRSAGLFLSDANQRVFSAKLEALHDRRLSSLVLPVDYPGSLFALRSAGLGINKITPIVIPFYSATDDQVDAYFLDVNRAYRGQPVPMKTVGTGPLPDSGYRADISISDLPSTLRPGQRFTLFARIQNNSGAVWPSQAGPDEKFRVVLNAGFTDSTEKQTITLPYDLPPGESALLPVIMHAGGPGKHLLELDMEQKGVARFAAKGSTPLTINLNVERQ